MFESLFKSEVLFGMQDLATHTQKRRGEKIHIFPLVFGITQFFALPSIHSSWINVRSYTTVFHFKIFKHAIRAGNAL